MLNKNEINVLREELNKSIVKNDSYDTIYKLSIKLDKLIAQYYKEKVKI